MPPNPYQVNDDVRSPHKKTKEPPRPSPWLGYGVIAVLCAAGGWGIFHGLRTPSPDPVAPVLTVKDTPRDPVETTTTPTPVPSKNREAALVINDVVLGTGAVATAHDTIKVHYVGTLTDGKEFDSSRKRAEPFKFELGKGMVIKGWDQGVAGMRIGGKRKLTIPPHLGYGARAAGAMIPPDSTLLFEVELLEVTRNGSPAPPTPSFPEATDPLLGSYDLETATSDLPGSGSLYADIDTSKGRMTCTLFEKKAPNTVANFIGLATGKRVWKQPATTVGTGHPFANEWMNRPAYDGTTFHRVIKGFMIQGGDPKGTGTGEPGYVIKDEIWEGTKHDRAGLLCMANRGPNTNGAQFFITDAAAAHLDNSYTIFGECAPVEVVHDIAAVKTASSDRPEVPVTINHVTISRAL